MKFRTVLACIEFGAATEQPGFDKAREIAARNRSRLVLFHAAYDPSIAPLVKSHNDRRVRYVLDLRRAQLAALARKAGLKDGAYEICVRWARYPVEAIVREARDRAASLVVAESTRRDKVSRLVLTNTDWELIRSVPAPLLLVKSSRAISRAPVVCAVDPTHARDKPAALDDQILDAGRAFAALLRAPLLVYHARSSSPTEPTVIALARRLRLPAAKVAVEQGDARLLIPQFLSARSAQLLVLGAIARGPLQRVLIGSTAEDILDRLSCDALIVKPPRARSRRRR